MKINKYEFEHYYELHQKWLNNEDDGIQLNLCNQDLSGYNLSKTNLIGANLYLSNLVTTNLTGANLTGARLAGAYLTEADLSFVNLTGAYLDGTDLRGANLYKADLRGADLSKANLHKANLSEANLSFSYLIKANLSEANLSFSYLIKAYLTEANLTNANLTNANLIEAKLTNTIGLFSNQEWIDKNLEKVSEGYICYKRIGIGTPYSDKLPKNWIIEKGYYLTEIVNPDRRIDCSNGVNFGTYDWCINSYSESNLWKCLIGNRYIDKVIVPYATDGKARCVVLKLLENLGRVYE